MTEPERDPRTDGVGDGGENELEPLSDEEIRIGVEEERARAAEVDYSGWAEQ